MKRDLYQEVTDRILAQLKAGTLPWIKPWRATPGRNYPYNAATNRPSSGCNVLLLFIAKEQAGWVNPAYVTFKQAKELGGTVRAGEHGTKVYFMKQLVRDENTDEEKRFMMLREYTVFNIAQCDGLPERITDPVKRAPINQDQRDPLIDEFLADTKAVIHEGGADAYYAPGPDHICLPKFADFKGADQFYGTAFHELAHWTGHKSRLDRLQAMASRFGSQAYAAEELVAELASSFLAAEWSIDGESRNASYIANWITLLTNDPRAIFTASSKASAAVGFLRDVVLVDNEAEAA